MVDSGKTHFNLGPPNKTHAQREKKKQEETLDDEKAIKRRNKRGLLVYLQCCHFMAEEIGLMAFEMDILFTPDEILPLRKS